MTVYVDNANIPYGRMIMCHMMADENEELHAMADKILISRRHFQGDHYDISMGKRMQAIANGAQVVDTRFLVELRKKKRSKNVSSGTN